MAVLQELKNLSLTTSYDVDTSFDSDKYIKMRLRVCHDGVNPNSSAFEVIDMEKTKESVKNIPILANVVFDEDGVPQFGGHDMDVEKSKINEKEYKLIYKETPIGLIPEMCNHTIEEFNGKNYVFVDGYIWKGYSNYAQDIIERDNDIKLSMEILVDKYIYDAKEKCYNITDYRYQGITFLNKDCGTGMENALATTNTFAENGKEKIIVMMEELKEVLANYNIKNNKEGGSENLNEKLELLAKYNLTIEELDFNIEDFTLEEIESKIEEFNTEVEVETEVETDEAVEETEEVATEVTETVESTEEFEVEKEETKTVEFSATYNQKREAINTVLNTITGEDEWMYISDMSDEYVFVEKSSYTNNEYTREFGRYAYTFDETELTATITSEFEKMILQWLTEEENQKLEERRSSIDAEFTRLQEFEKTVLDAERANSEQEIFANYDEKLSGEQAYTDIKENASNYSLEELEEKIALIFVRTTQNFSINKNKKETVKFKVENVEKEEEKETESRYGDLYNKYLKR